MGLQDTRETAAFNLALPYLMRINGVLNSNYNAFKSGNIGGFAINLRQLFRELRPWLVKDDKRDDITPIKKAFSELAQISSRNKTAIWNKMEDIEMLLRQHFKDLGMLMPKITDPRFLFGNKQK